MHNTVYLVITDLHISSSHKQNRINYEKEIQGVINDLVTIITNYKSKGYLVKLIFLGDIADRSYKSIPKAIEFNQLFVSLATVTSGMYTVVGNHEMSFYNDNPFWSLFDTVESKSITQVVNRAWTPTGIMPLVRVVDELVDGNVKFIFNHHPVPMVTAPKHEGVTIGLFHKELVTSSILEQMESKYSVSTFDAGHVDFTKLNVLNNYDYAFCGHLHTVYGKFINIDDITGWRCNLYFLASLGRPNVTEVVDTFLERNIPAVVIEGGKFKCVEDNIITLPMRTFCVKEDVVKKEKEIYQANKELRNCDDLLPDTDNPINNLFMAVSHDMKAYKTLESLYKQEVSDYELELNNSYQEAVTMI